MKKTIALLVLTTVTAFGDKTTTMTTDRSTKAVPPVRVYVTNYVQVPVVCASLDVADFQFEANRTYRLYVSDGNKPWRNWGLIRSGSNTNARVWFPAASTRPMLWQLIDVTPGFDKVALPKQAPDCIAKPQWVIMGIGNIRPVK